ncbi:MAG TPA: hypothetical protein DD670_07015 [Planctomycetaceae bacterium]|nr:hypothetical protein [Planctomycetaceae bacterium]
MNAGRVMAIVSVLVLAARTGVAVDAGLPVTFGQSGETISVRLTRSGCDATFPVVLEAYGRFWAGPTHAEDHTARFVVPAVRVPTVFRVVTANGDRASLAELVAYPRGYALGWGPPSSRVGLGEPSPRAMLVSAGAPVWFREWAEAVGLSVAVLESSDGPNSRGVERQRQLMIVGRDEAGRSPRDVMRFLNRRADAVLVLEANWFGELESPPDASGTAPLAIVPEMLAGELSDFRGQQWAAPPVFTAAASPWPGITNRWAWIERNATPLVERIGGPAGRITVSYVPWQRQLGRNELADMLFRRILLAAADPAMDSPRLERRIEMIWPREAEVRPGMRPVLAAAIKRRSGIGEVVSGVAKKSRLHEESPSDDVPRLRIVDLRGPDLPRDAAASLQLPREVSEQRPLVVLGTDSAFDEGRWADPPPVDDGDEGNAKKWPPGLTWLADDSLLPPALPRIQLMQVLTQWGVFLDFPENEEKE